MPLIAWLFLAGVVAAMAYAGFSLLYAVAAWFSPAAPPPGRLETVIWALVLDGWGLPPRLVWSSGQGSVRQLAYAMPLGVTVELLEKCREAIEQALNCSLEIWYEGGLFHLRAFTGALPPAITFTELYTSTRPAGELPVGVGMSRAGAIWTDLAQLPHLLVGVATGGGKTAFLRQLLTYLLLTHGPDQLRLALVDLKGGMELNLFAPLPHMLAPIAREGNECLALLSRLNSMLERRQAAFEQAGVTSLREWNAKVGGEGLPYVVLVVDELAELSAAETTDREERASRQAQLAVLARLCRLGRACGIHVITATQRPDADAVPGQVKANLPATVAFRVRGEVNSRILLGEGNTAAAALPPRPGRAIWQWDRSFELQVPWLGREDAVVLLARAYPVAYGLRAERVTPPPQCPDEGSGRC